MTQFVSNIYAYFSQESEHYNVYEKDIAVVNIFFGSSTVFGLKSTLYFVQF